MRPGDQNLPYLPASDLPSEAGIDAGFAIGFSERFGSHRVQQILDLTLQDIRRLRGCGKVSRRWVRWIRSGHLATALVCQSGSAEHCWQSAPSQLCRFTGWSAAGHALAILCPPRASAVGEHEVSWGSDGVLEDSPHSPGSKHVGMAPPEIDSRLGAPQILMLPRRRHSTWLYVGAVQHLGFGSRSCMSDQS